MTYFTTSQIRYRAQKSVAKLAANQDHAIELLREYRAKDGINAQFWANTDHASARVRSEVEGALKKRGQAFTDALWLVRNTLTDLLASEDEQSAKNWKNIQAARVDGTWHIWGKSLEIDAAGIRAWRSILIDAIESLDNWLA